MAGIIPETANGALVVRDAAGVCSTPANVSNYHCPGADFTSTCTLNYLPNDCTARVTAAQINAFQAEMLCLAETLNPDGNWNCGSVCNLSTLFTEWATGDYATSLRGRLMTHLCAMDAVSTADLATLPNASFIMCNGNGETVRLTETPFFTAQEIADALCADAAALTTLEGCLVPGNEVAAGDNITVDSVVDPQGQTIFTVNQPDPLQAAACSMPNLVMGHDGAQRLMYDWDEIRGYGLTSVDGLNAIFAGNPVDLTLVGTTQSLPTPTVTLTNPSQCRDMTGLLVVRFFINYRMVAQADPAGGNIFSSYRVRHQQNLNGAGFTNITDNQVRIRNMNNLEEIQLPPMDFTRLLPVNIPAGGTFTHSFRTEVEVETAFQAGNIATGSITAAFTGSSI